MLATHTQQLDSYLVEFLCRHSVKESEDPFEEILKAIATSWPLELDTSNDQEQDM